MRITVIFSRFNKHGIMTIGIMGILAFSIAGYILSMYHMFELGFDIQAAAKEVEEFNEQNLAIELTIQKQETTFASLHPEILESMEKVASIKYLTAENVALNRK